MAQRVVVELTDDIDGKPAAETVSFALDGRSYEIDLSERHATALRKDLEPWVAAARKVSGRRSRAAKPAVNGRGRGADPKAVRAWAAEQGIEVSPRGRIASEVIDTYLATRH